MIRSLLMFFVFGTLAVASSAAAEEALTSQLATDALLRGVQFFRSEVSINGGYLWRYAADFSEREGEIPASPTTVWVQPPGTPTVGQSYLTAYELTGGNIYLEAALETAHALVQGQLESGCWDYRVEFSEPTRKKYAYRIDTAERSDSKPTEQARRNISTLDDNTTQAALSFLMRVDRALEFKDQAIHETTQIALQSLLDAQYPNGAWPQRFENPPDPKQFPVLSASYPSSWSRIFPEAGYLSFYTFNDNAIADTIELMFLASEIYEDDKYSSAGKRGGDFILMAQMPEPQPGWAQQYDAKMHPAWARKFEPPAITGGESQEVMETLLRLYRFTGEKKYLEPLPRAIVYFQKSQLDDGRLARFYELQTNRPLYFTKDYHLTFSDTDLPTHYGFKATNRLDRIEEEYNELASSQPASATRLKLLNPQPKLVMTESLASAASKIVAQQNAHGAWIEPAFRRNRTRIITGSPSISCRTFVTNITILARFIAARKDEPGFVPLFDGKTLKGWQAADMSWWSVEEGAITARITEEKPCNENQYLFSEIGEMRDFELKLSHRIISPHKVNGGFQFRSEHYEGDDCKGYQVDNNTDTPWLVRLYDEFGRHTLAWRGQRTEINEQGERTETAIASAQGEPHFDLRRWHEYHLICKGNRLTLNVDGKLVAEVIDHDPNELDLAGLLALQLHSGPVMTVQFKDIRYKPFPHIHN